MSKLDISDDLVVDILKRYKITDIANDSRNIIPGAAFFAVKGTTTDGNKYIQQAITDGASVIFSEQLDDPTQHIYKVNDIKSALATACKYFFKDLPNKLIAVTGTSGKSSVVSYIIQILEYLHVPAASIGSLGINTNKHAVANSLSSTELSLNTQDIVTFYKALQQLKQLNIEIVAFEASSHGLIQGRLLGVEIDIAAFVSFSQDHLDYHGTMDNYFAAKTLLFKNNLKDNGVAVLNKDITQTLFTKLTNTINTNNIVTIGQQAADITIINVDSTIEQQVISFTYRNDQFKFMTSILGNFQATNILIAAAIVINSGVDSIAVFDSLATIKNVPGRLERVPVAQYIYVDYCHKPEALEKTLSNLRKIIVNSAKLLIVFGCGGNRDKTKRPIMGEIANRLADVVIVTDDNPRFESPTVIRQEIISGCQDKSRIMEIGDRSMAIKTAIEMMNTADILLIAGKGHETYQLIGKKKFDFSDSQVAYQLCQDIYNKYSE